MSENAPSFAESPEPSDQLDLNVNVTPDSFSPAPGACSNASMQFGLESDGSAILWAAATDTDPATDCAQWITAVHAGGITLTYGAVAYANGGSAKVTVHLD